MRRLAGPAIADNGGDDNELPFKVTSLIIELTDNDIELHQKIIVEQVEPFWKLMIDLPA
jgi:hypothetical protein